MPSPTHNALPLIFRGPPNRLMLHSALPETKGIAIKPDASFAATLGSTKNLFSIRHNEAGHIRKIAVRLNPNLKPGLYHASLQTSTGEIPVNIEIDPRPRLKISPVQLTLSGNPGDKVQHHILFINKGNVPLQVPATDTIGVYDDDGIETAFASTYRMDTDDVSKLFSNFTEKLREGHGGLLKLRIAESGYTLEPGTSCSLLIEAQLPSKLKPGHNYHGVWSLYPSEFAVTINVTK